MAAVSGGRPKGLLEVGGRPLLGWLVDRVADAVDGVCLVVGADDACAPDLVAAAESTAGAPVRHVVQPEPRGVGDAVLRASPVVSGPAVVLMGDGYYSDSLVPAIESWRASGEDGAVLVEPLGSGATTARDPAGYVQTARGVVKGVFKTEAPGGANARLAGMAVLPERTLRMEAPGPQGDEEIELEMLVAASMERGARFRAVPYAGWRRNVNRPEDLAAVRAHMGGGEIR